MLGICGGLQMLGQRLRDPVGVDGDGEGLDLLPLETTFDMEKQVRRATVRFASALNGPWRSLAGRPVRGYEIRHGRSRATGPALAAIPDRMGWMRGSVLGVTVHGLLEDSEIVAAVVGKRLKRSPDSVLDEVCDVVMASLDVELIDELAGLGRGLESA